MKNQFEYMNMPSLIARCLSFVASDEEQRKLAEWRKLEKNEEVYQEIVSKIRKREHFRKFHAVNKNHAWSNIDNYIREGQINQYKKVFRYAAAILLPIIFTTYLVFKLNQYDDAINIEQFSNMHQPGNFKAHLINEKGEVFELENSPEKRIEDESLAIENTGKSLVYSNPEDNAEAVNKKEDLKEEYHRIIIPTTGEYFVKLIDGTQIWVNSESEIRYPKYMIGEERVIELIGEAYFEVAHNAEKPFLVKTENGNIRVLGTHFNVKAYKDEMNTTTLVEGEVSVGYSDNRAIVLKPGQQAVILDDNQGVIVKEVNSYNYTAWKDQRFVFDKESLESIFKKLSRWYGADIQIEDERVKEIRLTADIRKFSQLTVILNMIEDVSELAVKFEIKDEVLLVKFKE